jgi:hypothetical protein
MNMTSVAASPFTSFKEIFLPVTVSGREKPGAF